jgi:hypothetical protein
VPAACHDITLQRPAEWDHNGLAVRAEQYNDSAARFGRVCPKERGGWRGQHPGAWPRSRGCQDNSASFRIKFEQFSECGVKRPGAIPSNDRRPAHHTWSTSHAAADVCGPGWLPAPTAQASEGFVIFMRLSTHGLFEPAGSGPYIDNVWRFLQTIDQRSALCWPAGSRRRVNLIPFSGAPPTNSR